MAVDSHFAQLHAVRVGSRRGHDRDGRVQILIAQTKCVSKWNVQFFHRNRELRLRDTAVDANGGHAARFSIGRYQRIDVRGGQFHFGLLVSACGLLHGIQAFANRGTVSLGVVTLVPPGVTVLVSLGGEV